MFSLLLLLLQQYHHRQWRGAPKGLLVKTAPLSLDGRSLSCVTFSVGNLSRNTLPGIESNEDSPPIQF